MDDYVGNWKQVAANPAADASLSCRSISDTTVECDVVFASGSSSSGTFTVAGSTVTSPCCTGYLGSDGIITWYDSNGAFFATWTR